jgi:lysophospholipase L1-like esterase
VWKEYFSQYLPINMGNSGDITPVMLYRVRHGNLAFPKRQQPDVAVLMCGTNNFVVTQSAGGKVKWDLGPKCPPEEVAEGVRAIAQEFRRRLPRTRLIVMGILPVANQAKRAKCREVNRHLKKIKFDHDKVVLVDLWEQFIQPDGSLRKELFTDGTHLTTAGYRVWARGIESLIEDLVSGESKDSSKIRLVPRSADRGSGTN